MIESISHITFIVRDVGKTADLLRELLGAEEIYDGRGKNFSRSYEMFFLVGGTWIVVMEGEALPGRTYSHVAFRVSESEFDGYLRKVQELGLEIAPGRSRVEGEGRSVYFYDFDNQ